MCCLMNHTRYHNKRRIVEVMMNISGSITKRYLLNSSGNFFSDDITPYHESLDTISLRRLESIPSTSSS